MTTTRHRLPPLTRQALEECIGRDLTTRGIALELGRSQTTIRYWLRRHGLATTGAARRGPKPAPRKTGLCDRHGETFFVLASGRQTCARCRADAVSQWRRRAKTTLVAEAGGRCVLCGYQRCIGALQFHHLDRTSKRFSISGRGLARAIDDLRAEAAKCVLLCANCHAEVETGTASLPLEAPDRG